MAYLTVILIDVKDKTPVHPFKKPLLISCEALHLH